MGMKKSLTHSITYSVITSQPALTYSSVLSSIRCWGITSGEQEGSTFVEWTGDFSSDADAGEFSIIFSTFRYGDNKFNSNILVGVIADAKFKRREALDDLAKAAKAAKK